MINLIGTTFKVHGQLDVNIVPVGPEGEAIEDMADELIPEEPEELLDQSLNYVVQINKALSLPDNFCRDPYVEYSLFLSEDKYRTNVAVGKQKDPEFNYAKQHTQECVTENFLKYLKDETMTFKVYGYPDVKKKDEKKKKPTLQLQTPHTN